MMEKILMKWVLCDDGITGIILGMGSANERRRYYVTPSLIGWVHSQKNPTLYVPWLHYMSLWVQWRLKSPASRLFAQPFVEEQIKETSKLCITRHQWLVDSPLKGPVTQKIFPFDDIIMSICILPTYVIISKDLNFNQHIFLLSFTRQCRIPRNIIC